MAISGLNKQEAITLLQRQGLSTAQQAQILSSAGLLQTTQMLNASLIEEALTHTTLSTEKQKELLVSLGLADAKTKELITSNECTVAEVAQALATKGIVGADAEAILSQLGLATANTTTTISFSGLTTAIKANTVAMAKWLVTNPVGWCILAVGAIYGLTKAYDALTVSEEEIAEAHEESAQKVKDSISKYEELKQELETIQQTYEDNEQKLKDLYKLRENQTITQAEKDYLEELESQNQKLEAQIKHKQTLADIEAKDAEKEAVTVLKEKTQNDLLNAHVINGGSKIEYDKITDSEKIKQNTSTIDNLTSDLIAYEKAIKGIDLSDEEISKFSNSLQSLYELEKQQPLSKEMEAEKEFLENLLNGTITYEEYEKAVSKTTSSVEGLIKENGELLEKVEPLNDAIVSTTGKNYELKKANDTIIENAWKASGAFNDYTESLNGTAEALGNVEEKSEITNILNLSDAKSLVQGADGTEGLISEIQLLQEVLADTGNISQETYEKLLSCSKDYATAIRTENGRITLNTTKLKQVAKQRQLDTKATIKETLAIKKQEWLQWKNKIENYNGTLLDSIETKYDDIDALQAEITQYELLVNSLDNATSAFERFKAAQSTSNQDMYDTAQDAFNVLKEYSSDSSSENYGKYNTDEFQEAAMLLMDSETYKKALNAKDLTEYQKIVNGFVKSISPLFDENNAKSASKLFDEVDKIVASGDVPVADQDWADRLGISKEAFNALKQLGNLYDYNNKEVFESFPLDKLDDYQEKVSNVAEEYKTLNSIEDKTSNEYLKQEQAYKQAKEKRDAFIEETTTDMSNAFTNYQKSGGMDGRTFADYVKDQFDFEDTDVTGSMFALIDKADTLKEKLNTISPNKDVQKQFAEYDELQMLVSVLDALGYKYEETANNSEKLNKSLEKTPETTRAEAFEEDMKSFEKLKEQEEMFKRQMASSTFGSEMYTDAQNGLSQVQSQLEELRGALKLKLELDISDVETKIGETEKAKQKFQQENSGLEDTIYYRGRTAGYDTELEQLNSQKDTLEQKLKIVIEGDEEAQSAIDSLSSATIEDKTFSVSANDLATTVIDKVNAQKIADKTFNITANLKVPKLDLGLGGSDSSEDTGGGGAYGTVNIGQGRAYADGNIGTDKELKNVMVGEVAPEMVVDPHSGEYTIYQNPTMLDKLPKNAIVFNGKQTKEILENGMTTSFGKAYANGNVNGKAFKTGTKTNSIELNDVQNNNNAIKGAKNNKSSSEIAEEEAKEEKEITEEFLDWIERRVQKLQRYFDRWIKNAETALTSGFITKYYNKARKNLNKQMDVQSKAYNRYLEEANKSGLSDAYKKKVRDGLIDIEAITDDALKEQVSKYQENFDKAINSLTAFEEAAEQRFNIPLDKATQKVELFSDAIDLLDKRLDNAVGAAAKNKIIGDESDSTSANTLFAKEKKTLNAYKKAVKNSKTNLKNQKKKMKSSSVLNSSGDVSKEEKKKIKKAVKNGKEVDLSFFKEGSKAYKQAVKYNEALKANKQAQYDLNVATEEYNAWLVEAAKMKFDNIADEYEYAIKQIENNFTDIDNKIAEIEAVGKRVDKSLYESQKKLNDQELAKYKAEKVALEDSLKEIKQGTEEWYEALDAIQEVENSISNCTQEAAKLNAAIRELHFKDLDDIFAGISRITKEQDFLQSLFAHEDLTDNDTGNLTEAGVAKLGSLSTNYYVNQEKKELATVELDRLKRLLSEGDKTGVYGDAVTPYNSRDELIADIEKYYDVVRDYTSEVYNSATEIYNLMEQKYQAELEYVKRLIEDQKEALRREKDLHDYQRQISEKTNDINTIQRQIAAYKGDSSEEGRAKLQRLENQLTEAQDSLKETEYDRYISDQQDMLDKLKEEYEESITTQLKNFEETVKNGLKEAKDTSAQSNVYLAAIAKSNGYEIENDVNLENIKKVVQDKIDDVEDNSDDGSNDDDSNKGGGNNNSGGSQPQSNNTPTAPTPTTMPVIPADNTFSSITPARLADNYISTHVKKIKNAKGNYNKDEYSDVNKAIMKVYDGKALTTKQFKELAKTLGVKYDNATKNGALYKKLKKIDAYGFKTGGIAELIKAQGEDGIAFVRNKEGLVAPEHVPAIQELLDTVPLMNDMLQPLVTLPKFPDITSVGNTGNNILQIDTLNLPNVTNWEEFKDKMYKDMQSNKKFEGMVQDMSVNKMSGGGRLTKYRQHF